ncbi:MAG: hypothetical protein ABFS34_00925 [Gemmatimonadota bacterium]
MTVRYRRWQVLAAGLALAGCEDAGLRGAQLQPLREAALVESGFETVAADPDVEAGHSSAMVRLGRQAWVATAEVIDVPRADIRSVGGAEGRVFSALRWDSAPYDRLLVETRDGRWQVYAPVIGVDPADRPAPLGGGEAAGADEHG